MQLYIKDGIEIKGPYDEEDLKCRQIYQNTLIWYQGLSDWTIAENITELKSILNLLPPPENSNKISYRAQKKIIASILVFIFTIVMLLTAVYFIIIETGT